MSFHSYELHGAPAPAAPSKEITSAEKKLLRDLWTGFNDLLREETPYFRDAKDAAVKTEVLVEFLDKFSDDRSDVRLPMLTDIQIEQIRDELREHPDSNVVPTIVSSRYKDRSTIAVIAGTALGGSPLEIMSGARDCYGELLRSRDGGKKIETDDSSLDRYGSIREKVSKAAKLHLHHRPVGGSDGRWPNCLSAMEDDDLALRLLGSERLYLTLPIIEYKWSADRNAPRELKTINMSNPDTDPTRVMHPLLSFELMAVLPRVLDAAGVDGVKRERSDLLHPFNEFLTCTRLEDSRLGATSYQMGIAMQEARDGSLNIGAWPMRIEDGPRTAYEKGLDEVTLVTSAIGNDPVRKVPPQS